jgi:hypothetical protein
MRALPIDEQQVLISWMQEPRQSAPAGYEIGDNSNDRVMNVLVNYIDSHGLPFNRQSLNAASISPEMKTARVTAVKALWPEDHGAIAEDYMTKRMPTAYKVVNGRLGSEVAAQIIAILRRDYNGEVSTATLDAAAEHVYPNIVKDRQAERTARLQQKDHDARRAKPKTIDDEHSEDRAQLKNFFNSIADSGAHEYVVSAAANAQVYRSSPTGTRVNHGATEDLRKEIQRMADATPANGWTATAHKVKQLIASK